MKALKLSKIANCLGCEWQGDEEITVITTDSREILPGSLFVALKGERFDGHNYVAYALEKGASAAIISHNCDGDKEKMLCVTDTKDALITIGGLYRNQFKLQCVGVTGSVGKTTTKEMIAAVVASQFEAIWTEGNLNNEIGMPKTLFRLQPTTQVAVIEMGMQGLGEITKLAEAAKPNIGVITNIGVSHLEQLGTREAILKAKLELAQSLPDGAQLFLCGDNDLLTDVKIPRLNVQFYGIDSPICSTCAEEICDDGHETTFILRQGEIRTQVILPCTGRHNIENALAACCVGNALDISPEKCAAALKSYVPAGRRQKIVHWNGMTVVEDCYNASPDSMRAALETLGSYPGASKRIAVLADMLELGIISNWAHYEVGSFASQNNVNLLLAWGEKAKFYVKGAVEGGIQAVHFSNADSLLVTLRAQLCPDCVVWVKGSNGMHMEKLLEALYRV